jgi:hypothetical protein
VNDVCKFHPSPAPHLHHQMSNIPNRKKLTTKVVHHHRHLSVVIHVY